MQNHAPHRLHRPRSGVFLLALAAILLLAAALRFQNLHAIEHNVDHAYPVWQALMTLDQGAWPVTAQGTSVLFANPALTGYLYIPAVALTRSPFGPYLFVLALNMFAIWLAYQAAARLLDARRALIAAFLMAVNPWVIEYSRTTWVQALMPFFACLAFWLLVPLWLGEASRPGRRIVLAACALTAMTQTYLLAFAILVPVAALAAIFRRRMPWRAAAVGLLLFAAATGLYGLGLLSERETFDRLRTFAEDAPRLSDEAWSHALRLVSGRDYPAARGLAAPAGDAVPRQALSELVHYVILAAILAGAAAALHAIWRRKAGPAGAAPGLIALVWFGAPLLLLSYVSRPVHPFYLLLSLPAGYVLAAWGAGLLLRWRVSGPLLIAAAIPIAVLSGVNVLRYAEETLALPGAHGLSALPVGAGVEMLRELVPAEARGPGAVIFADTDAWILNSFAGALFPVDRDVDVTRTTYIPRGGATYLRFTLPGDAAPTPIGADAAARYELADGTAVQRYRVLPESAARWQQGAPLPGDSGITYLGAEIEQPPIASQSVSLLTAWRIDALAPDRAGWLFGPFLHVFGADGERVAIGDGAVTPGAHWRQGDIHLKRIRAEIPADATGPFRMLVGLYDGVHNRSVIFTLPDGSHSATIPVE